MNLLLNLCLFGAAQVFLALAALLRLTPAFLIFARACLRGGLLLSCQFYRLVLTPLSSLVERQWGVSLLDGFPRIGATLMLSLVIGLLFLWLIGWPITGWSIGLLSAHGLFVGLAWDDLQHPNGLHMGEKLP